MRGPSAVTSPEALAAELGCRSSPVTDVDQYVQSEADCLYLGQDVRLLTFTGADPQSSSCAGG